MKKNIDSIIGSKIISVKEVFVEGVFDFWDIATNTSSIGVYNAVKYGKSENLSLDFHDVDVNNIINRYIVNIEIQDGKYFTLELDNSYKIYISLKEENFIGPEAALISFNTGEFIVID